MQDFFIKEEELDNFQTQLIQRNIDHPMVVSGCAGSGKSIIALWKAKQINDLGKSFYFVVYTKVLKKYFDDGIKEISDPTLEGMRNMLNDERKFFYYDKWKDSYIRDVEFMIIDEAQDFDKEDIEKLKSVSKTAYFFGDSEQSIYKFKKETISMGDIARSVGLEAPERLMHNYRLPKKVARVAEIIGKVCDLEWRCVKDGENLPQLHHCTNYNAQLDKIAEIINKLHLKNVCILFCKNTQVSYAYNYMRRKGINVEAKYDDKNSPTHLDIDFTSDNPKLITYHSAKGLQFETVFIPQPELFEGNKNPRAPLYVAMTRTSDRLYFLYSGNRPNFFDEVPNDYFNNDNNIIQL
jgi:superfamily I DNA/RNA helicase